MYADLHVHSSASDGKLSPEELVALAARKGLNVIAITDHDTVDGIGVALAAAQNSSVVVIPALEINTDVPGSEVHMLGYFIDHTCAELIDRLKVLRRSRHSRARRMVEKANQLGLKIEWQQVVDVAAGAPIGRPHIAQVMLQQGYISSISEAFGKYIGRNCPAYVEREKITPLEAINLIKRASGLPVLAHPALGGKPARLVQTMKSFGIVGIEAYYNGYAPAVVRDLVRLARRHGLIYTGGSDFHGLDEKAETPLGGANVPEEAVQSLFALAGRTLPSQVRSR